MSEIWYRISRYDVEPVACECDRSTDEFLVFGKRKDKKISSFYTYHPTWEEARQYSLERVRSEAKRHELQAADLREKERELIAMVQP